jgi:hypothetical protein
VGSLLWIAAVHASALPDSVENDHHAPASSAGLELPGAVGVEGPAGYVAGSLERLADALDVSARTPVVVGLAASGVFLAGTALRRRGRRRARRGSQAQAGFEAAFLRRVGPLPEEPSAEVSAPHANPESGRARTGALPRDEGDAHPEPSARKRDVDQLFRDAWAGKLVPRRVATLEEPSRPGPGPERPSPASAPDSQASESGPAPGSPLSLRPVVRPGDSGRSAPLADEPTLPAGHEPVSEATPLDPLASDLDKALGGAWEQALMPGAGACPEPGPVSEAMTTGETQRVLPPARAESAAATESEIVGLLQFSRAEAARGRLEEALDLARQAHRIDRGRASLAHLQQLLIQARRFEPDDGAWLRQAAAGEPEDSASLHAAGLFEALHGDAWAARGLLGAALEQARCQSAPRKEIVRDLARLAAHDAHNRS